MIDYKEYTKLRDIAQKRIKRAQAAGVHIDIRIPTVKELRHRGEDVGNIELMRLEQFVRTGFSLARRAAASRPVYTAEERRARKNQQNRDYRRRKVAREYEREEYPNKYQSYLKGLQTMWAKLPPKKRPDIPPSKLPGFFAYMDSRFAQGSSKDKKYVFDIFVDDFLQILKKGYNPDQIMKDFDVFMAEQSALAGRANDMQGMSYERSISLYDEFKGHRGL